MKAQATMIQGALAVVGLIGAYATWQRPKETVQAEKVLVVDASKKSLERVRLEDGSRFLELFREAPGSDKLLVTQGYLPGKEPVYDAGPAVSEVLDAGRSDAGSTMAAVTPPPPPPPIRTMRAGERANELLGKLTPFEATRALGVLSPEKVKDVGLTETERTLKLTVAGATRPFTVAKPLTGLFGWYLRDDESKQVYLLEGALLNDLDPATQVLVERRLHTFKLNEFDSVVLTLEGKSATFTHVAPDNIPTTVRMARPETPEAPDEMVKNWHEKVFSRVIITEVLGRGEVPRAGEPKVALRIDYSLKGQPKGFVELAFDPSAATWARSETTEGWVAVHQGSDQMVIEAQRFVSAATPGK